MRSLSLSFSFSLFLSLSRITLHSLRASGRPSTRPPASGSDGRHGPDRREEEKRDQVFFYFFSNAISTASAFLPPTLCPPLLRPISARACAPPTAPSAWLCEERREGRKEQWAEISLRTCFLALPRTFITVSLSLFLPLPLSLSYCVLSPPPPALSLHCRTCAADRSPPLTLRFLPLVSASPFSTRHWRASNPALPPPLPSPPFFPSDSASAWAGTTRARSRLQPPPPPLQMARLRLKKRPACSQPPSSAPAPARPRQRRHPRR